MNQHRQSECGNLLSLSIVVQYQHHEPHAVAGLGVLPHLPIAGRIAERGVGPAGRSSGGCLRLAGVVVVQQQLRPFGENRPTVLVIAVAGAAGGADDLLGWDASSSRPRWA